MALKQVGPDGKSVMAIGPCWWRVLWIAIASRAKSYRAANWQLIGTSQGRGRKDPKILSASIRKIFYVYPLDGKAREQLQKAGGGVDPSSSFAPKALSPVTGQQKRWLVGFGR